MGDLNVTDRFMAAFIQYIDSGFGLLRGDVAFLSSAHDVIGRPAHVGAFALIIGSLSTLVLPPWRQ